WIARLPPWKVAVVLAEPRQKIGLQLLQRHRHVGTSVPAEPTSLAGAGDASSVWRHFRALAYGPSP
ncbi:MAG: hypothetical protein QOJ47_1253, partial [Gaiellales bacterium]|nr:hypothetical protein [Gaiellales bacterium]